ncbi:hypothetical protein [Microvirga brassicacearum]|uniref:Uncharacterized protein n=1 Tax=Microvirga brassicacearum TaxID=2580413 RepID=A0A5N3P5S1_9HYPH|nr:hypothetical protein [Microvirga brassicacearum]KAB0265059.1 hypothetical protein FEZ63_20310 [Microvirga brassicacearum]
MDQNYRGLLLRGRTAAGKSQVAIIAGQKRLHIAEGATFAGAVAAARAHVDAMFAESAVRRRAKNIGTVDEYVRFFAANPPREHHAKLLKAHSKRPMTMTQLAAVAGWDGYKEVNANYGSLEAEIGRTLGLAFDRRVDDTEFFMSSIVEQLDANDPRTDHALFEMHPEVAEALRIIGLV